MSTHPTDASRHRIGVVGLGGYLPPRVRGNSEVARAAGVSPEWISERTGVHARHVAAPGQAASDLATAAVRAATEAAGIEPGDLSLLICATSTPDELGPATACRIQAALGAQRAVALDVSAACSGWLFGTKVAHDWLAGSERPGYAAVVGVEAYSKFLDPTDRATSVLFADGAAATVLGPVPDPYGFTDFALGSDGTRADYVLIPAGGSRMPADTGTLRGGAHQIRMDGRAVSHFMDEIFPRIVADALDRNGLTVEDIACLACHQPNPAALRRLTAHVGVPADRLVVIGDRVGNIGAASAPYALATAAARNLLHPGDRVLLTVFGAGMTWGTALLHWSGARAVGLDTAPTPTDTDDERLPTS